MDTFKLLKQLTETPGPSGYESQIASVVQEIWKPLVDTISTDPIGNLIAVKNGRGSSPRSRLMLAAHMDEIGLMVKQIVAHPEGESAGGFLRVTRVGGVDVRQLYDQAVLVHGTAKGNQELVGVIGALPGRMLPEERREKPFGYDDLVVDVGLSFEELKNSVAVGDFISFRQPLRPLLNRRASGKALDNRASVAAVAVCLEYLAGRHHDWDVVAVATAQEETRLLGAFTSAFAQVPDVAVAVDVTLGKGPAAKDDLTFELDGGPTVAIGPNVHRGVHDGLRRAAENLEMKVHVEPHARYSGTDAFGLQISRAGIPTGLVGIPLRYMHTMVETVALADIERTGRLLGEFAVQLDDKFLEKIAHGMMAEK